MQHSGEKVFSNSMKPFAQSQKAMTLVEAMIGFVLFLIIAGFLVRTLRLQKLSWNTVEKLDVIQSFRIAERKIRKELEVGTSVLWPPPEGSGSENNSPYLVFTGPTNIPYILYIDRSNRLVLLKNNEEPEILCEEISSIHVRHVFKGLITIRVVANSKARGLMGFTISVSLLNGF